MRHSERTAAQKFLIFLGGFFDQVTKTVDLSGIFQIGLEIVLRVAGRHPFTMRFFDDHITIINHARNRVDRLKLIIETGVARIKIVKNFRSKQVAAIASEIRRSIFDFRLLDNVVEKHFVTFF